MTCARSVQPRTRHQGSVTPAQWGAELLVVCGAGWRRHGSRLGRRGQRRRRRSSPKRYPAKLRPTLTAHLAIFAIPGIQHLP